MPGKALLHLRAITSLFQTLCNLIGETVKRLIPCSNTRGVFRITSRHYARYAAYSACSVAKRLKTRANDDEKLAEKYPATELLRLKTDAFDR